MGVVCYRGDFVSEHRGLTVELLISSVTTSASGFVSASVVTEDGIRTKVAAGVDQDATFLAWMHAKAESIKLTVKLVNNKRGGTVMLFYGVDEDGSIVQGDAKIDFAKFLGRPTDSVYQGLPQRTYWIGAPRKTFDFGTYGE